MSQQKQFTPREGGKAKPAPVKPAAPEQPTDQQEGK